jgi:hypothetical protein
MPDHGEAKPQKRAVKRFHYVKVHVVSGIEKKDCSTKVSWLVPLRKPSRLVWNADIQDRPRAGCHATPMILVTQQLSLVLIFLNRLAAVCKNQPAPRRK